MRKFLLKISYTVLPVWLLLVGNVFYVSLFVSPRLSGDLGVLAFIPFGHEYHERMAAGAPHDTLFHTITSDDELAAARFDVLTVGDSFSQQQADSYQNYLAHSGLSVANCSWKLFASPVQYAYNIMDHGLIDSTRVRVLILETAERVFEVEMDNFSPGSPTIPRASSGGGGNEWSLARARDMLFYKLNLRTPVYKAALDCELFSSDEPSTLYFYYMDIVDGTSLPPSIEGKVREVQAALHAKAAEKGIKLIWLIAADKYDLYQDHIIDNKFPRKTIIDDIRRMLHDSTDLMFAKDILLPMVDRGEKDVYLFNDSHWSHVATEAVARELRARMDKLLFAPTKPILNQ